MFVFVQVGKFLTFIYSIIMAVVMVGTAVQIASDFDGNNLGAANSMYYINQKQGFTLWYRFTLTLT